MPKLSSEEEHLVESLIFLEMTRKVLEKDLGGLEQAPLKIKEPYVHLLESALFTLSRRLHRTKWKMKQAGITVHPHQCDETFSEYNIFFRGYVVTAKYLNTDLRDRVSQNIEQIFLNEPSRREQAR